MNSFEKMMNFALQEETQMGSLSEPLKGADNDSTVGKQRLARCTQPQRELVPKLTMTDDDLGAGKRQYLYALRRRQMVRLQQTWLVMGLCR